MPTRGQGIVLQTLSHTVAKVDGKSCTHSSYTNCSLYLNTCINQSINQLIENQLTNGVPDTETQPRDPVQLQHHKDVEEDAESWQQGYQGNLSRDTQLHTSLEYFR